MSEILLDARNLHVRFGGVAAADGVNLAIYKGENVAIIGPNGAGKTTFLNICTGYLKPTVGSVRFDGRDITGASPRAITRRGIARSFQVPQLFLEHTTLDNLLLTAAARDRAWRPWLRLERLSTRGEMMALLDLVGIANVAGARIGELPEGTRKLADIAVALALRPRLLLMDEPTSGVSSSEKFQIMDLLTRALGERAVTAVFVEHDMEVVSRYAHRVAVWSSGRIQADGPPGKVLSDAGVLRDVIGM